MSENPSEVQFINRISAAKKIHDHWIAKKTKHELLRLNEPEWQALRNYEYETMLEEAFGGEWCINEWCPFNGRFCKLAKHINKPHPPMRYEGEPYGKGVGVPWNTYDGVITEDHRTSDRGIKKF